MELFRAIDILSSAHSEICELAASVGINGQELLANLPPSGQMLKGAHVPVVEPRYRHACGAILYINSLRTGGDWPFLSMWTFKDGGHKVRFNGLSWAREGRNLARIDSRPERRTNSSRVIGKIVINNHRSFLDWSVDDGWRLQNFQRLLNAYRSSPKVTVNFEPLKNRLGGHISDAVLARTSLKVLADSTLLLPVGQRDSGHLGFQTLAGRNLQTKRYMMKAAGVKKGCYGFIKPEYKRGFYPVALCEGLVTGLTLANFWKGEIRICLDANNLVAVRSGIDEPVVIFHDNDIWKPEIGNVGLEAAKTSVRAGDILCGPEFLSDHFWSKPTDFNDLLLLQGAEACRQQILRVLI